MNTLDSLFVWLTEATLRGALLILLVLAVQVILGRMISPQWRYALWLPVLLVLVAPLLPQSRWSAENIPTSTVTRWLGIGAASSQRVEPSALPALVDYANTDLHYPVDAGDVPADGNASWTDLLTWKRVATVGWIVAAMGLFSFSFVAYARTLRRIVTDSVVPNLAVRAMLAEATVACGLRSAPRLILSRAVASPAVTGLFRPTLLLPASFPADLTEEEAQLVLRHELIHLKRWDLPVNWLLCLIQALHWCNPLLWLAVHRIRVDRETACDAQVLALSQRDSRAVYGHALLKLEGAQASYGWTLGFVGIFERKAAMRTRIRAIARYRHLHPATSVLAGVLLMVLTLAGATRAQEKVAPQGAPKVPEALPIQRKLETIVIPRLEFREATLQEIVDLLTRKSVELDVTEPNALRRGVRFALGADVRRGPQVNEQGASVNPLEARITVALKNIPLIEALRYITGLSNTDYRVGVDGVEVVLSGRLAPLILKEWVLESSAGFKPGDDAQALLTENGVTFPAGATASLSPDATRLTVRNTQANLDLVDNVLDPAPQADPPKMLLRQKLSTIIIPKLELRQTPLREAVKLLMRTSWELDAAEEDSASRGVNIVVHRSDRSAEIPRSESASVAPAREEDAGEPRMTLSLRNISLGEALRYVAGLSNHIVMVGPYSVTLAPKEITNQFVTKEWKLNEAMITALGDPPRDIVDRLEAHGIPFPVGATAIWFRNSRKLLARNTQENHERLDALLFSFMGEAVSNAEQARAERLLIPTLVLRGVTLRAATEAIQARSVTADPEKKGVKVVLDVPGPIQETKITLSLTNTSVWDALRQTARLAEVQLTGEANAVRIHQPGSAEASK